MKFEGYRYKFEVNAYHSVLINNKRGNVHPHTFEISLFIKINDNNFLLYNDVEKIVEKFLDNYREKEINLIKPFDKLEPSIENIGDVLFTNLKQILSDNNIELIKLEISENPTRVYIANHDSKNDGYKEKIAKIIMKNNIDTSTKEIVDKLTNEDVHDDFIEQAATVTEVKSRKNNKDILSPNIGQEILSEGTHVVKKLNNMLHPKVKLGLCLLVLGVATIILMVTYPWGAKGYPWGADTYGHIFKADMLYNSIKDGNIYPLFNEYWYNGIQPFRYWGPLSYYVFAGCEFIAGGNPINAYVIFVGLVFFIGGLSWIIWGVRTNRIVLSLTLGILWFFLPENLRIFFIAGNMPRVVINTLMPFLFYFIWEFVEYKKKFSIIPMTIFMCAIIMCHLMIGAMIGISCFIFLLIYSIVHKNPRQSAETILSMLLSFAICGIWVYPALHGGLVSMDSGATSSQMMELLSTKFTISLNPILRMLSASNMGDFYYGISILLISILGIMVANKKCLPGFITSIIIFLGTTTAFVPILIKMPFSQLLWMVRFAPIAYGFFIISLLNWTECKKQFVIAMIILIAVDSSLSFNPKVYPEIKTDEVKNTLNSAKKITNQRISLLDDSTFGSYPSFYMCNQGKKVPYSYGWAWQGAATSQNIMLLNTALEKGYYNYMFDRSLEMGCDTVIIAKAAMDKNKRSFGIINKSAKLSEYDLCDETSEGYVFHRKTPEQFGIITKYSGLCIGKSSTDVTLQYPSFEIGKSSNIEDYTIDELSKYKVIYLSNFIYNNRNKAENMVSSLSKKGIKVVIDMNKIPADSITNRTEFLGVTTQPITFENKMPDLYYNNKIYETTEFKDEYKKWNSVYLNNVPNVTGFSKLKDKKIVFLGKGKGENKNITFLGFNLMFHGMENEDKQVISMMNEVVGSNEAILPKRNIMPINLKYDKNLITINSPKENINTTLSFLDAYSSNRSIYSKQSLLNVSKGETKIRITYPYLFQGITLSLIGLTGLSILLIYIYNKKEN